MRFPELRRLQLAFSGGLVLLSLLAISEHLALAAYIEAKAGSAAMINSAGRQRMLTQRIALLANRVGGGDGAAAGPLQEALTDYDRNHATLMAGASATAPSARTSATLSRLYFSSDGIDATSRNYLAAARRIAHAGVGGTTSTVSRGDLAIINRTADGALPRQLDSVVVFRQRESETNVGRVRWMHWLVLAAVLATLLAISRFIFLPMSRQIEQSLRALIDLADRDALTGLNNRRSFSLKASRALEQAVATGSVTTICMIDIDHFKSVNDQHGHGAGDAVLVTVAHLLRDAVRNDDLVARIGGEEFAVLMPRTDITDGRVVAERLRSVVAQRSGAGAIPVTISLGIASLESTAITSVDAAVHAADTMLYRAKHAGRNCVWPPVKLTAVASGRGKGPVAA